jgi:hypothetical protein
MVCYNPEAAPKQQRGRGLRSQISQVAARALLAQKVRLLNYATYISVSSSSKLRAKKSVSVRGKRPRARVVSDIGSVGFAKWIRPWGTGLPVLHRLSPTKVCTKVCTLVHIRWACGVAVRV